MTYLIRLSELVGKKIRRLITEESLQVDIQKRIIENLKILGENPNWGETDSEIFDGARIYEFSVDYLPLQHRFIIAYRFSQDEKYLEIIDIVYASAPKEFQGENEPWEEEPPF